MKRILIFSCLLLLARSTSQAQQDTPSPPPGQPHFPGAPGKPSAPPPTAIVPVPVAPAKPNGPIQKSLVRITATEVEPDTFSNGNTIVSVFQQGRFNLNGGCSDIGWATSLDAGVTWQHGSLPGLTRYSGGTFLRISDPAVAFDAAHGVWLAGTLPVHPTPRPAMLISRSTDGITWNNPVNVTPNVENSDKTWVACDNNTGSPFFGHCYGEWDDNFAGDVIFLNTSTDGGLTWGPNKQPAGGPTGLGGQPFGRCLHSYFLPRQGNVNHSPSSANAEELEVEHALYQKA